MITNGVQIISNWFTFAVIQISSHIVVRLNNPDVLLLFLLSHDKINFEQKSHYSVIITGTFKLSIINRIAAQKSNEKCSDPNFVFHNISETPCGVSCDTCRGVRPKQVLRPIQL